MIHPLWKQFESPLGKKQNLDTPRWGKGLSPSPARCQAFNRAFVRISLARSFSTPQRGLSASYGTPPFFWNAWTVSRPESRQAATESNKRTRHFAFCAHRRSAASLATGDSPAGVRTALGSGNRCALGEASWRERSASGRKFPGRLSRPRK